MKKDQIANKMMLTLFGLMAAGVAGANNLPAQDKVTNSDKQTVSAAPQDIHKMAVNPENASSTCCW